ncbi:DUF7159 family protein [Mycobacterium florentinum]|uniref:DUF7159 family protein n=1 Tax=Mycobacterium florentinum TaxID=292462 RepID=UPI00138B95B7|nr:hypothetical protein [Mycobacterium florentinum]MCV7409881.1 hypothetical protein [Mycobacterium florentinum]BBX79181.1 hypothetical protein MFLOJ_29680 [Mycobacterium florentinum]
MDIVLGVSIAPASVQMVMLQGENADGPTIDENEFAIAAADDSPTVSASDRVIAAIMCTREDAAGAGLELDSIGVACTDQLEAAVLRDALAAHKIENVLLVSAFVAAAALTQSVGGAMGYERTAMLFVEPDTATLAVVETSDGSVDDVRKEQLDTGSAVTAELVELIIGLDELPIPPGGLFVVGSGVDITPIRQGLEDATSLIVNVPEEPETALARGAALASANALASPTAALAYALDPGTGAVDVSALPEYLSITHTELGEDDLAYSAVTDDEADAQTVVMDASDDSEPRARPGLLVGSAVAVAGFSAALALEIALSLGIRTTVGSLPAPIQGIIAPVQQALLPAPEVAAMKMVAPEPLRPPPVAPAPTAPLPAAPPVVVPAPAVAPVAPAMPVPVFVPPIAPAPVPPVQLPDPPASPPVVEAPPHSWPPIYLPRPKSPPHRPPPEQGPPPNSGGGGPTSGSGPVRGNPGTGGPHGGGPGHGAPGSGPTSGGDSPSSGPPAGGGPVTGPGHDAPGSGPNSGGPTGGGPTSGGPTGGGQTPSGGAPTSGGEGPNSSPPAGSAPPAAGAPSGGGPTGGSESPSGGAPSGGGETPSGGGPASGSSSSGGAELGGGSSPSSGGSESGGSSPSSGSSSSGSESSGGSSSSSSSGSESSSGSSSSSSSGSESSSSSSSSSSGSSSTGGH